MRQRVEGLLQVMVAASEPLRVAEAADLLRNARTGEPLRPADVVTLLYRLHVSA